jgi:hypothetical protein
MVNIVTTCYENLTPCWRNTRPSFGFCLSKSVHRFSNFSSRSDRPHKLSYTPIWFSNSPPPCPSAQLSTNFVTVLYIHQLTSLSVRGSNPGPNIAVNFVTFFYAALLHSLTNSERKYVQYVWRWNAVFLLAASWGSRNRGRKRRSDVHSLAAC